MDFEDFENNGDHLAIARARETKTATVDEAISIATQFSKYYFEVLEKKPHKVDELYMDNAVLIWDGNPIPGRETIKKFFEHLPALTFNLMSLDCDTLHPAAVGNNKAFIIKTTGQYRASGSNKPFNQQIIITAEGEKWRIASDIFRSQ